MKQLRGLSLGCAWLNTLCDEDRATGRLYDFVGITFFSHVILIGHDYLLLCFEALLFLCFISFYLESFGSEHSCHNKENYIKNYAR